MEEFIKARPREFAAFVAFRATRVEAEFGFVEYYVACLHRQPWQDIVAVLQSKADLSSFALELSKKMNLRYHSPPMPIDLNFVGRSVANMMMNAANSGGEVSRDVSDGQRGEPSRERLNTFETFDVESSIGDNKAYHAVSAMFK
jgi:hypothetical protein